MQLSPRLVPFLAVSCAAVGGFAISFALPFGPAEDSSGEEAASMEAYAVATRLVEERDAALMAGDAQALASLTDEGSPARRADEELLAEIGDELVRLETVVMDVRLVTDTVWDVTTVQYDYATADGVAQGEPMPERCSRWTLRAEPWRLVETSACQ